MRKLLFLTLTIISGALTATVSHANNIYCYFNDGTFLKVSSIYTNNWTKLYVGETLRVGNKRHIITSTDMRREEFGVSYLRGDCSYLKADAFTMTEQLARRTMQTCRDWGEDRKN